jgi:hypothetical protein
VYTSYLNISKNSHEEIEFDKQMTTLTVIMENVQSISGRFLMILAYNFADDNFIFLMQEMRSCKIYLEILKF